MNQTRGIGQSIGTFNSPARQPNPAYWQTQHSIAPPVTNDKKKVKNLLIQSYWVIWLLFAFIVAYVLGFLILENPIVFDYR